MMTASQTPDPKILEVCSRIEQVLLEIRGNDNAAVATRLQIEEAIETAYEIAYARPRQECIILPWPSPAART
jgi:hypothetical protein